MKIQIFMRTYTSVLSCLALLLFSGCASKKIAEKSLYFPPPPSIPRIQYLTSISSSEGIIHVSAFKRFLMGPPKVAEIIRPQGVYMRAGKIYVCDTARRSIIVADLVNRTFYSMPTIGGGGLETPLRIEFDSEQNLYLADISKKQVVVYGPDNVCRWLIGSSRGTMKPTDVAIRGDNVYVSDMTDGVVKVYDRKSHKSIGRIPREPTEKDAHDHLYQPISISLYHDGSGILVSDIGGFRVQHYDLDGNYIKTIGAHGDLPGQFARPKGIAVDREGRVYVVDASLEVVQIFDKEGRLLSYFGQKGNQASLILPADVHISYEGMELFSDYISPDFEVEYLILVTSQFGPRKISIFGYGRIKN